MIELDKKQKLALELLSAIKKDNRIDNNFKTTNQNITEIKQIEPKRSDRRHYHPDLKAKINNKEYSVLDFSISGVKIKIDAWDFTNKNSNDFFAVFQLNEKTTFVKCRGIWIDRQNKEMGIKFLNLSESSWVFFNDTLVGMVKPQQPPQTKKKFWGLF
jgi:hypothetical protein